MNKIYLLITLLMSIKILKCQRLESYKIEYDSVTVSGLSSGAAMAVQLHVAFSSIFQGVGIVSGPPYHCANGLMQTALTTCINNFGMFGIFSSINVYILHNKVATNQQYGLIDDVSNMNNDKVYIFAGKNDKVISNSVTEKNFDFYKKYVPESQIKQNYASPAGHAMVTDNYGCSCTSGTSPFIENCDFNLAFDILNHLYGNLKKPKSDHQLTGDLLQFSQTEFFPIGTSSTILMDPLGFVYVPRNCTNRQVCKLHVALHGCLQQKEKVGNTFAKYAGYNQVADLNNIIVVYPQAKANLLTNPNGCWDWWGYSDVNYSNKQARQMKAIKAILDTIMSNN